MEPVHPYLGIGPNNIIVILLGSDLIILRESGVILIESSLVWSDSDSPEVSAHSVEVWGSRARDGRFDTEMSQINPKRDKFQTLSNLITVDFGSASQNVLNSDLKKSGIFC